MLACVPAGGPARYRDAVIGEVYKSNGSFDEACTHFTRALEDAEHCGEPGLAACHRVRLAGALAWSSPQEAIAVACQAVEENQRFQNRVAELEARMAFGLAGIGTAPSCQVEDLLAGAEQLVQETGAVYLQPQLLAVRGFHAVLTGRNEELPRLVNQIRHCARAYGFGGYYADVLLVWSGGTTRRTVARARVRQWLDSPVPALGRWYDMLTTRRALVV